MAIAPFQRRGGDFRAGAAVGDASYVGWLAAKVECQKTAACRLGCSCRPERPAPATNAPYREAQACFRDQLIGELYQCTLRHVGDTGPPVPWLPSLAPEHVKIHTPTENGARWHLFPPYC